MSRYPKKFLKLPDSVKDAWIYTGRKYSMHIVLKEQLFKYELMHGLSVEIKVPERQIDVCL